LDDGASDFEIAVQRLRGPCALPSPVTTVAQMAPDLPRSEAW
jgi:hypothetical protein